MSEFYADPELTVDQELALLRARISKYTSQNEILRKEIDTLKDKNTAFIARVKQLEFETKRIPRRPLPPTPTGLSQLGVGK